MCLSHVAQIFSSMQCAENFETPADKVKTIRIFMTQGLWGSEERGVSSRYRRRGEKRGERNRAMSTH